MKINWIEKLASEGHIRKEAKEHIYQSCRDVIKLGSTAEQAEKLEGAFLKLWKDNMQTIIGVGAIGVGVPIINAIGNRVELSKIIAGIKNTKKELLKNPDFARYPEKMDARINEIVSIAPVVTTNKVLLERLVKDRLHEGLSTDDVAKLSILQSTSTPKRGKHEYFTSGVSKAIHEKRAAITGRVMADMYFICKEAGIDPAAIKAARKDAAKSLLKTTLLISAFPILQGLGTGLVKHFASKKDQKSMEEAHVTAFNDAMNLSDPHTEPLHSNKDKAKQVFKALVHFAPHVAMEPQAARAFMNRFVNLDLGIASSDIRELSEIEKNMRQGGNASPFLEGLFKSLESSSLSQAVQKNVAESTEPMKHQTLSYMGEAHGLKAHDPKWREII